MDKKEKSIYIVEPTENGKAIEIPEVKDFKKLYEDIVKSEWFKKAYHDKSLGDCPFVIDELEESEDERVRKWLYDYFSNIGEKNWIHREVTCEQVLAWLEKQKEKSLFEEAMEKMAAISRQVLDEYEIEEQKEQKPVDDSDFKTKLAEYMMKNRTGYSYSISSESILEMAKEELIKRGELKEQEPINSFDIVPYIDDKIAALQDMWREEKVAFDWDDMHEMIEDVARHFYQKGQNSPDSTGLYYYDGKKFTCCGFPYNFTMNQQEEQKTVAISENNNSDANGHLTGKILVEYGAHAKVRDGKRHCEMDWKEFQRLAHYFYELGKTEQKPAEWSEKHIADVFEKVGLAKIAREQGNDKLTNALQDVMLELSKVGNAEWSEEDEKIMQTMIKDGDLKPSEVAWLKALRPQPKPEWSEEDVKRLYSVGTQIGFLKGKYSEYQKDIDWLYALADKMGFHKCKTGEVVTEWKKEDIDDKMLSKPKQEWSEEDEEMLEYIIGDVNDAKQLYTTQEAKDMADKEISWLKSLRPQYNGDVTMTEAYKMGLEAGKASSWKPSEEQMEALERASTNEYLSAKQFDILVSLYEQLKKMI